MESGTSVVHIPRVLLHLASSHFPLTHVIILTLHRGALLDSPSITLARAAEQINVVSNTLPPGYSTVGDHKSYFCTKRKNNGPC